MAEPTRPHAIVPTDCEADMHWKRIFRYTLLLVAATFVAGFAPGFTRGVYRARNVRPPPWVDLLPSLLLPAAVLVVFLLLARAQARRTIGHAMAVWGLTTLASAMNMTLGVTPAEWAGAATYSAVLAAIGTAIGTTLPGRRDGAATARAQDKIT